MPEFSRNCHAFLILKIFKIYNTSMERQNIGVKSFICLQCGKKFTHRKGLERHERIHNQLKQFKCMQCGKAFDNKDHLKKHKQIHNKKTSLFKCLQCGKTFQNYWDLKFHKKIHTGIGKKQFKCSQCQKECWDNTRLIKHEMVHSGIRPFKCHQCGKDFTNKISLEIHGRTHTGEKPSKCSYCSMAFIDRSRARRHERQMHSKMEKEAPAKPGSIMSLLLELKSILITSTQKDLTDSNSDYLQLLEKIAIWRQSGYDVVMGTYLDSESVLAVNGLNQLSVMFTRIGDKVGWTVRLGNGGVGDSGLVAKGCSSNFYRAVVSCVERFLMWGPGELIQVEVEVDSAQVV